MVALFDYRSLRAYAPLVYVASILGLIAVLAPGVGATINGSHSWILLPAGFSLQPSEFAKVALCVALPMLLAERRDAEVEPRLNDLLLALVDKIRNSSKLIRDPAVDTYYLEDGAAQELPEGIVAAAQYTDLLVSVAGLSAADQAKESVDINSARSDLVSNAHDLSDDVRLAVEGTGSRSLGGALLKKLDRFNQSIDNLVPLMSPVVGGKGNVDAAKVVRARDEMQTAAADLSAALLTQIDTELSGRLSSLSQRRLLAIGTLVVPVLLALVPIGLAVARRRRGTATPEQDLPETTEPGPAHQAAQPVTVPPDPWPVEPAAPQWPEPRPHDASNPEYARWERFGASQ